MPLLANGTLDAAALLRTAAVVRDRRHVRNQIDADAQRGQRPHRRLAPRAGALDAHIEVLDALLLRGTASHFGGHLGGKRRGLARTLEALAAAGCPGESA